MELLAETQRKSGAQRGLVCPSDRSSEMAEIAQYPKITQEAGGEPIHYLRRLANRKVKEGI